MTMTASALISSDGRYRYRLERRWGPPNVLSCTWVMLNPSTADAETDDPTIRRCIDFAKRWGYGGITVANLFAYRAAHPADLVSADDPVGPDNDEHLTEIVRTSAGRIVCAWGRVDRRLQLRRPCVEAMADHESKMLYCLGVNADGSPKHPLYLPSAAIPVVYRRATRDVAPVRWHPTEI